MLLIDEEVRERVKLAMEEARKEPRKLEDMVEKAKGISQDQVIKLADRPPGYVPLKPGIMVEFYFGHSACISFEEQPIGLCKHLSISVNREGVVPAVPAIEMIAEEFGILPGKALHTWLEEFMPGCFAVNLVALDDPDANPSLYLQ